MASKLRIQDIPIEEEPGITESLQTLINYSVQMLSEALKADIRQYPGGLTKLSADWGLKEQTLRAFWNPLHPRSIKLYILGELLALSPLTNLRNALNTVADTMTRHRQEVAERRSRELRAKLQKLSSE